MKEQVLIINLSYQTDALEQICDPATEKVVLDMTGAAKAFDHGRNRITYARDLDTDQVIEENAVREYLKFVGDCGRLHFCREHKLTDINVGGLRIYWLTGFSEKSAEFHWGYSLFFFKCFAANRREFFNPYTRLIFVFPKYTANLAQLLESYVRDAGLQQPFETVNVSDKTRSTVRIRISLSKVILRYIFFYTRCLVKRLGRLRMLRTADCIAITECRSLEDFKKRNNATFSACEYARKKGKKVAVAAVPGLNSDIVHLNSSELLKYIPGIFQLLNSIWKTERLLSRKAGLNEMSAAVIPIMEEIESQLLSFDPVIRFLTLKNYFSSLRHPVKVIYEDEMYRSGRLVTSAINAAGNSCVQGVSVQHGLFSKYHTVYQVSDSEICNGFPFPDRFLVWGSYFQDLVCMNNSINRDKVPVAGNLKYINFNATR